VEAKEAGDAHAEERTSYLSSPEVSCVELEASPNLVGADNGVFATIVFLAEGVIVASNPFGLQGENSVQSFMERQTIAAPSSVPCWWHRPA
jgi:hypothetical protein